jgi:hypothetical protein
VNLRRWRDPAFPDWRAAPAGYFRLVLGGGGGGSRIALHLFQRLAGSAPTIIWGVCAGEYPGVQRYAAGQVNEICRATLPACRPYRTPESIVLIKTLASRTNVRSDLAVASLCFVWRPCR